MFRFKVHQIIHLPLILLLVACQMDKEAREKAAKRATLPPNIVVILADDLGRNQLSCYGSQYYQTPNIDQLAAEGMKFNTAYSAAAVCSPTRASIMTGKYPARLNLTDFLPGNANTNYPLLEPQWQKFLPLEEVTIAEMMKENGYATAHFGKWHLSIDKRPPESEPYNPDKQGFDEFMVTYKPKPNDPPNDAHNVEAITEKALDFMERKRYEPFLLFLSHNSIHDPLIEKPETIAQYEALPATEKPENNAVIGAMLQTFDNSVGQVLEKIKELELEGQTVVIFYSDNGGKAAYAAQTPFRQGKGWLYEGGIRVPLIVKWPEVVEKGSTSDEMVCSIDLFPTLLEITENKAEAPPIDGLSFVDVLKNVGAMDRETLYWHYPHYHQGSGMEPAGAIRKGNYKLIEWYQPYLTGASGQAELFDLSKDEGEMQNLAEEMPALTEELRKEFGKWRRNIGGQMPGIHPNYAAPQ